MSTWTDPEEWRRLYEGEWCPICDSIRFEETPLGTIVEMGTGYLTTRRDQLVHGYCCLVLKRHAVELHDLEEDEAGGSMRDMRRVDRVLKNVTGAVKMNLEIHGNTIPHPHVHFFPRYAGDRFEGGPPEMPANELEEFGARLRTVLAEG